MVLFTSNMEHWSLLAILSKTASVRTQDDAIHPINCTRPKKIITRAMKLKTEV